MRILKLLTFYLALVLSSLITSCQTQNSEKEIKSKIDLLYSKHEDLYEVKLDKGIFSPEIIKSIQLIRLKTIQDTERIKNSDTPTDKPFLIEGSIFTSLIDGYSAYKIQKIDIQNQTAKAIINFEYQSDPTVQWTDTIIFTNRNGWRIDNIIFSKEFHENTDLINRLKL